MCVCELVQTSASFSSYTMGCCRMHQVQKTHKCTLSLNLRTNTREWMNYQSDFHIVCHIAACWLAFLLCICACKECDNVLQQNFRWHVTWNKKQMCIIVRRAEQLLTTLSKSYIGCAPKGYLFILYIKCQRVQFNDTLSTLWTLTGLNFGWKMSTGWVLKTLSLARNIKWVSLKICGYLSIKNLECLL